MNKSTPNIEWTIAQSDEEWERQQGPPLPDAALVAPHRRFLNRYGVVAALCLLVIGIGDRWWHVAQVWADQMTIDATATAQAELALVTQQEAGSTTSDLSSQLRPETTVQTVEVDGDQMVAQVISPAQGGAPALRQTRFYQRTTNGWVQTPPDAARWGAERSLETPYVIYHFRQQDAQAVIAVSSQIGILYQTMQRNFALPVAPDPEKLVIDVSLTARPGQTDARFQPPDLFTVSSPVLYNAPVALSDADLLAQSIALRLLNLVMAQASEQHGIGAAWQPLMNGLELWQLWDLELPLAIWREDVVKWLYLDLPANRSGEAVLLPPHYPALCTMHKLWMPYPVQIHLPLVCGGQVREEAQIRRWDALDPPTHLHQLAAPAPADAYLGLSAANRTAYSGQAVALATLAEYAVATYGRERLPALVAGLGQYESWETLIPTVYGVSAAEFEAGWRAYLAEQYGISIAQQSGSEW
jgi:hypothetical protein